MKLLSNLGRLAILLCTVQVCRAQEESGTPSDRGRTMRVMTFGASAEGLFYQNGSSKQELVICPGTLTYDMPMPSGSQLTIFRESTVKDPVSGNVKNHYKAAGSIELVPGARKAIVVLIVPADLSRESIRGRAFKDSYSVHPAETVRVFNLSPKEVALRASGEARQFEIGGVGVMPWQGGAAEAVAYQLATRESKTGDRWNIVDSGERASRPGLRAFAFVSEIIVEGVPTVAAMMAFDELPLEATE